MVRWLARLAAFGCVVVLLAGCSSSSSKGSHSPPSADALRKIVLRASDLPATWKATPYQPGPSDSADQAEMAKCVGVRDTQGDEVAEANSDDFSLGGATISSSATSYRTQSDVNVDIAMLLAPNVSACAGQLLSKHLAGSLPGAKITSVSFKVTPGSAGGPPNIQAIGKGTVIFSVKSRHVGVYLTVAFITGPQIEAEVTAASPGSPPPGPLVQSLARAVATRAARR